MIMSLNDNNVIMSIKHWPQHDRPREKLLKLGATALSDTELLAILLRTGTRGMSAVDLARELISKMGSLRALLEADCQQLCQHHGMGMASYTQFAVIREISRRMLAEEMQRRPVFTQPEAVADYLRLHIGHEKVEVCVALLLNQRNELMHTIELARGTINETKVYIREVATTALNHRAASIILAHNHPGQSAMPSNSDIQFTKQIKAALNLLEIRLLDHFIITAEKITSMADLSLL
ncbi:DNA repair protein RadC [Snodgrassella sp. R-53583]|nr:DNA repair protein RadC [Snodgrassella sp. R-53583]